MNKQNCYFELNYLQQGKTDGINSLENVNNVLGINNKAVERNAEGQPNISPGL